MPPISLAKLMHRISAQSFSPRDMPSADACAAAGVTTAIVHPPANDGDHSKIFPQNAPRNIVISLRQHLRDTFIGANVDANRRRIECILTVPQMLSLLDDNGKRDNFQFVDNAHLTIVDSATDLDGAEILVQRLLPLALQVNGKINKSSRSAVMLGVMAVSGGRWNYLKRMNYRLEEESDKVMFCERSIESNVLSNRANRFICPVQSCEVGRADHRFAAMHSEKIGECPRDHPRHDSLQPVGFVTWVGAGVTRVDSVTEFSGRQPGGEGQLLLSQIVAEVVAKVGLKGKFGA